MITLIMVWRPFFVDKIIDTCYIIKVSYERKLEMKKASKTLLIIGAVLSIVLAVTWFILSIVYFVIAAAFRAVKEGTVAVTSEQLKEILEVGGIDKVISHYSTGGVIFLILFILAVASCVLAFVAKNRENKGLFIANIVLGLACGAELNAIGGVLGLVAVCNKKE